MEQRLTKVKMYIARGKRCPHFPAPFKLFFSCGFTKESLWKRKDKEIIVGDKTLLKFKVSRRSSQLPAEPHLESFHLRSKIKASTQPGFFYKQHCDPRSVLILKKKPDSHNEPRSQIETEAVSSRGSSNKSP